MKDIRNAFGHAPIELKESVAEVLNEIKQQDNKKSVFPRTRALLLAALITLLLSGVVYAAMREYRLAHFYQDNYQVELQPELQEEMALEAPAEAIRVGDLLFQIQEVYIEGRKLYASVNISTADGSAAYYMATDVGPSNQVSEFSIEGKREDSRNYLQAAQEDGRRLFYIAFRASIPDFEGGSSMMDYAILPDGTMAFVITSDLEPLPDDQEKIEVEYLMIAKEVDTETGEYLEESYREHYREEITIHQSDMEVMIPVGSVFENSAIRLDEIQLRKTIVGYECLMYCSEVDNGDRAFSAEHDLWIALVDVEGEYLQSGPGGGSRREMEDGRWRVIESLQLAELPQSGETIYVRLYEISTKNTVDIMEIQIQ